MEALKRFIIGFLVGAAGLVVVIGLIIGFVLFSKYLVATFAIGKGVALTISAAIYVGLIFGGLAAVHG